MKFKLLILGCLCTSVLAAADEFNLELEFQEIEDPIVKDESFPFEFRGLGRQVFLSDDSAREAEGAPSGRNPYYILPILELSRAYLDGLEPQRDDVGWYVDLHFDFLDAELRDAAARAVARKGITGVSGEDIAIYPYSLLTILRPHGTGEKVIYSNPMVPEGASAKSRVPSPGARPTRLALRIREDSEDGVRRFLRQPDLRMHCYLRGFSVSRNVLQVSIRGMLREGLKQDLVGEGKFWQEFRQKHASGGAGLALGPLKLVGGGGAGKSGLEAQIVLTREQVKNLVTHYSDQVSVSEWTEWESDRIDRMFEAAVGQILASAQAISVDLIQDDEDFVVDPKMVADLTGTGSVKKLNEKVQQTLDFKRNQKAKGKLGGEKGASGEMQEDNHDKSSSLLEVDFAGDVPKAVKLYQFNARQLTKDFDQMWVSTRARRGGVWKDCGYARVTRKRVETRFHPEKLATKVVRISVPRQKGQPFLRKVAGDWDLHSEKKKANQYTVVVSPTFSGRTVNVRIDYVAQEDGGKKNPSRLKGKANFSGSASHTIRSIGRRQKSTRLDIRGEFHGSSRCEVAGTYWHSLVIYTDRSGSEKNYTGFKGVLAIPCRVVVRSSWEEVIVDYLPEPSYRPLSAR